MQKTLKPKPIFFIFIIAIALIVISLVCIFLTSPVNSRDTKEIDVEISNGTSTLKIGTILKEKNIIRSKLAFNIYVKLHNVNNLKAGTYKLNRSMNLNKVIKTLEKGSNYNPNLVVLTFKEGERITDYVKIIASKTNNTQDEIINIINDENYLKELINEYWFLTNDILTPGIYYPLEGYIAPDTYHYENKDVTVKEINKKVLDEEEKKLEPYKADLQSKNIHEVMTMASIVELEGTNSENRKMIVGVFNNRLNSGYNMGSDVTTYYGLQVPMTKDLTTAQFNTVNKYNTRTNAMIGKLPISPISTPSLSSIDATLHPTNNNYLFFVADKNGKIYYSRTNSEHDAKIAEIKRNGDWIW